jgi:KTSC domain
MSRIPVDSSTVNSVLYHSDSSTLEVEFKNGNVYQYFDVPEAVYTEFMTSDSKGEFLAKQIKGAYRYARL